MEKKKYIGLCEMMLRLSPPGYLRFAQADNFAINYTGAEANMAVSLSYMGMPAAVVTKFPDNEIGRCAERMLVLAGGTLRADSLRANTSFYTELCA